MNADDKPLRATIAAQASEWFVANDAAPLDAGDSTALVEWLKTSPAHVEELLAVSVIARDLREACAGSEESLESLLADASTDADARPPRAFAGRWGAAALAAGLAGVGLVALWWNGTSGQRGAPDATTWQFATRHGEQQLQRLADHTLLRLNTDSAVTVRYSRNERLVTLTAGEAEFEVEHEAGRAFRVIAGAAQVVDLGTAFNVRLTPRSSVVTVLAGRVAVGPADAAKQPAPAFVQLGADQQLTVADGVWRAQPLAVDAKRATAWMHRQISFDHEPLAQVAAEFNRYSAKPIEVVTPALRGLLISGVFSTDDPETFLAFVRRLDGVRVEVTPTRILVFQK